MKDTLAYRYASAVMEGKKSFTYKKKKHNSFVGEMTRKGVERFFRDLEQYEMNWKKGYVPIQFIEKFLHHWKGPKAGQNFELEAWQHFYFMNLFGFMNDQGLRRFNRSYLEVARKNGKTSLSAGLAVYHITAEAADGLQCYVGATKEEQARITVNDAGRMVQKSPQLSKMFDVREHQGTIKRVFNKSNFSFIAPLGRDSRTQDGFDPSMGIIDEFHEHQDTRTIDVIESGMVARKQPLLPIITTAGFNKIYPCYSVTRKSGVEVLNQNIRNDRYMYLIYTMDDDDDMENPDLWIKANPNLGVSVIKDQMTGNYETAKAEGGQKWVNFLTKNLNIWTDSPDVWIQDHIIKMNNHGITEDDLIGQKCFMGVDLGVTDDFTSVALFFPDVKGVGVFKLYFWIPQNSVRDRRDNYDFSNWVREGWITIAGEDVNDYRVQVKQILDDASKYQVMGCGYDSYKAMHGLIMDLEDSGFDMYPVPQRASYMATPTEWLHTEVKKGALDFMENPVLYWQFGNVVIDMDANNNVKPSKKKSENKIDGIYSMLDAISVYLDDIKNPKGGMLFGMA